MRAASNLFPLPRSGGGGPQSGGGGRGRALALAAGVSLFALPAHATDRMVSEVVVTAAPYAVTADSLTSHVDVVSTADLQVAAPGGIGDMLNGLPGLRSSAFGPGASRPIVRGLSGPRVLMLQNGLGQIDVSEVSPDHAVASDPAEASRIEVLRGPSTLAYGGSGVGGVVNVIDDRIPSEPAANGLEGRLSASGSTVDDGLSLSGAVKAGAGPWVVALDGAVRRSDDYQTPAPPLSHALGQPEPGDRQRNSAVELEAFGAGVSYVGAAGFVGVSVRKTDTTYGLPYPQILGEAHGGEEGPVEIHLQQTRLDARGEHDVALGPFERVKASAGWADYYHAEVSTLDGEAGTQFFSEGYEGRLELVQAERDGWQGAIGVQGLHRKLEAVGDEAFIPSTTIGEAAVFTLQRLDRGGWGLEGGLRLDRRTLETPALSRDFTNVSGSIAGFLRPDDAWFLSLNYSHNARAPTEVELFADGPHAGTGAYEIGDPDLGSETVDSVEATARYAAGPWRLEGHLYHARYDGYIEQRRTGEVEDELPVFQFFDTEARFTGAELEGAYDLWDRDGRRLTAELAYDAVRGEAGEGNLARIPPASLTARLEYEGPRLEGRLEVRGVAEQEEVAPLETPSDGYALVNLFVAWRPFEAKDLRLFAEGRNLTDETAREHASFLKDVVVGPARNLRLGMAYAF